MASFVRDLLKTLTYDPRTSDRTTPESEALARLDARLSGISGLRGKARSVISIRPSDCVVWQGNPRDMQRLSAEHCRPLIDSISRDGGNRIPIVLRHAPVGSDRPYELLVGNRRRFAVDWLNHNGRPEIRLNALVVDLNDEEAFRFADIENQERKDIAELDRARSYFRALDRFYGGVQSRMADALNLSNSQLSRLLALAEMPDEVVEAFPARDELRIRHSEVLTPMLRKLEQRERIIAEARRIGAEQERLCAQDQKMLPAATVLSLLKEAGGIESEVPSQPLPLKGESFGNVAATPQGVHVDLMIAEDADLDEVLAKLRAAITDCRRGASECLPG